MKIMKRSFEIYPALFRITPRKIRKVPGISLFDYPKKSEGQIEKCSGHDISFPHIFYGNCMVNAAHTLVTLTLGKVLKIASPFELPASILNQLNIQTFQGKDYVITYVPVMN
jgi:hypothetical protein